jgi:hypothetical protein
MSSRCAGQPTPQAPKRRQRRHLPGFLGRLAQVGRRRPGNIKRPQHVGVEDVKHLFPAAPGC